MNNRKLNSNQQVVLELLKEAYVKNRWATPFGAVSQLLILTTLLLELG